MWRSCLWPERRLRLHTASIMQPLPPDILHCIGHTSLMPLRHIAPKSGARILLKLENENPTGSMKDRMALAMIEAGEAVAMTRRLAREEGLFAGTSTGG